MNKPKSKGNMIPQWQAYEGPMTYWLQISQKDMRELNFLRFLSTKMVLITCLLMSLKVVKDGINVWLWKLLFLCLQIEWNRAWETIDFSTTGDEVIIHVTNSDQLVNTGTWHRKTTSLRPQDRGKGTWEHQVISVFLSHITDTIS